MDLRHIAIDKLCVSPANIGICETLEAGAR